MQRLRPCHFKLLRLWKPMRPFGIIQSFEIRFGPIIGIHPEDPKLHTFIEVLHGLPTPFLLALTAEREITVPDIEMCHRQPQPGTVPFHLGQELLGFPFRKQEFELVFNSLSTLMI